MATTTKKRAMPKFTPAPAALVTSFGKALKDFPMAEQRKMFSYPAAFVDGRMFAALFQSNMMLRLPEADRNRFIAEFKTTLFEVMPGRPMKEYVLVPPAVLKSPATLKHWLGKALAYTQSLPPKEKKRR